MSGLLDALDAAKDDVPTRCPIAIVLTDLRDDDQEFDGRLTSDEAEGLEMVLNVSVPNSAALVRLLNEQSVTAAGRKFGLKSVQNHRNNVCSCRRK